MCYRASHRRGSALVLAIIVSVVMTALVSAMCWVAGESAQRTGSLSKIDQAFYAAEAGAQRVQWYCKNNKMNSISAPVTGSINGYAYSVTWSTVSGSTILITSVGTVSSTSYTLSLQVTPPVIQQPTITSMGAFDNKNIAVTGDVMVATTYDNGGNGSITGNLTYYGSASNTGSVSGSVTHASGSPTTIDFAALASTLTAAAGRTYNGDQNNVTFDFTAISGSHPVIYVNGNVSNPTFIGSGTLYVTGNITGAGGYGSAGAPVDLVAQGDINTNNNTTIVGSVYTKGNWNRGKFNLTGLIYTGGIVQSNNGMSYLTQANTPWWDPRGNGGGTISASTTTNVTDFAGPMP